MLGALTLIVVENQPGETGDQLLNVSYDPTRELYRQINAAFESDLTRRTGRHVHVVQSHGGSSQQARAVISGEQPADIVTLGLFADVDSLRKRGLIASGWAERLPHHSQPYTSTIVFVVREHNPKHIRDWPDLVRAGVDLITPDPKTSGNGKLSALAAWGAVVTRGGTEEEARRYLVSFYRHVRVMDAGARGAAMTFASAEIGDVHLTWENEALREVAESQGMLDIVYPPVSILAEPYVAWVDANVRQRGTFEDARSYLELLFTDTAQHIIADLGYRPSDPSIVRSGAPLPSMTLFPVTAIARDWEDAEERFFAENGIIDGIMKDTQR